MSPASVGAVIDASAVVAALLDDGELGEWARAQLGYAPLNAPHLMPVEVAGVLRRAALAGDVTADAATLAHSELVDLRCAFFPYAAFAERVWALRANLHSYDAWYVALAEELAAPLVTVDERLARTPGLGCEVLTP